MRNLVLVLIELALSHGLHERIDPNCPLVPRVVRITARIIIQDHCWLRPNDDNFNLVFSDYDLNTVCNDICIEETLKCITICDSTDSECIYRCMRAEITCLESKFCNTNIISYPRVYRKNRNSSRIIYTVQVYVSAIFQNFV